MQAGTDILDRVRDAFVALDKNWSYTYVKQMESYYEPWKRWFENRIYPSPERLSISQ